MSERVQCDYCPETFDPEDGCPHGGLWRCPADLHECPECVADLNDDLAGEASR